MGCVEKIFIVSVKLFVIERTPREEIPEGFFTVRIKLAFASRVAVPAATLSLFRQISEERPNKSHRDLGPVDFLFHGIHLLSHLSKPGNIPR